MLISGATNRTYVAEAEARMRYWLGDPARVTLDALLSEVGAGSQRPPPMPEGAARNPATTVASMGFGPRSTRQHSFDMLDHTDTPRAAVTEAMTWVTTALAAPDPA
jgi:hypothetical protein